ncbi:MAG: DUF126 domain-containing protein [Thermoprotei archaeon]|nr:DUF126 domain-containing protein [Thermoprotei archaeon]
MSFRGRPVVSGDVEGFVLRVESISFYGDVDPESGRLYDGRSVSGRVIVAEKSRGSTVGPYVLYALRERGLAPKAILLVSRSDPVLVAGAVLSSVVLVDSLPRGALEVLRDNVLVRVYRDGGVVIV